MKINVSILDQNLRADALRVGGLSPSLPPMVTWVDAPVKAATTQKLETLILTRPATCGGGAITTNFICQLIWGRMTPLSAIQSTGGGQTLAKRAGRIAGVSRRTTPSSKPRSYVLEMFPYPSAAFTLGHVRTTPWRRARSFRRMQGYEVLHPMVGIFWHARKCRDGKESPSRGEWTRAISHHAQPAEDSSPLPLTGSRELATCDPITLWPRKTGRCLSICSRRSGSIARNRGQLDPVDHAVLAKRAGDRRRAGVRALRSKKRKLSSWFPEDYPNFAAGFAGRTGDRKAGPKKSADAGKLDPEIARLAIPFALAEAQADIAERSTVFFHTAGHDLSARVSSRWRRPSLTPANWQKPNIAARVPFAEDCKGCAPRRPSFGTMEKKGLDTGLTVTHRLNPDCNLPSMSPISWLMDYGTARSLWRPAHDQRVFDFARKYDLPVKRVGLPMARKQTPCFTGDESPPP